MKRYLVATAQQPATISELQVLLDAFVELYKTRRPHRSLPGHMAPAEAYRARPKATPGERGDDSHGRVRRDV